jgi:hypothetical protein
MGATAGAGSLATSGGFFETKSRIKMVAVDAHGRKSVPVEGIILYTPCGVGNYWLIELEQGANIINTREIVEGMGAYGFGFDLTWQGGGDNSQATVNSVAVTKAPVGENL